MVKVSAPGKIILFGEHAVVYGRPSIGTSVDHRMVVEMTKRNDSIISISAKDINLDNYEFDLKDIDKEIGKASFLLVSIKNFFEKYNVKSGLNIKTSCNFSGKFGFGSSSATTTATIKALSIIFNKKMTEKEIFDISYKTILDIQKSGSGFDAAISIWGKTLFFQNKGEIVKTYNCKNIPLIVCYSGSKADTTTIINQVKDKMKKDLDGINKIFDDIRDVTVEASNVFERGCNPEMLGKLMNKNQALLKKLGVSTIKIDNLIDVAIKAGAYGAKISGAGGGDSIIVLADNREEVENALERAGGTIVEVKTNVDGLRVD